MTMQLGTSRPYPHMEPFEISAGMVGPTIIVMVSGELDMATSPQLSTALAVAEGPRSVVIDLSEVTFVDTRSLRVIVAAQQRLGLRGVVLAVRRPSPVVRRRMELLGLGALIEGEGPATSAATATPTNHRGLRAT